MSRSKIFEVKEKFCYLDDLIGARRGAAGDRILQ